MFVEVNPSNSLGTRSRDVKFADSLRRTSAVGTASAAARMARMRWIG